MVARNQANSMAGILLIVMAMVMVAFPGTKAQEPPMPVMAPGPSPNCLTLLLNMSDCLTFVEAGSNLTKPDKGCCPELAGLVESNPICLCQLLGDPRKTGIQIELKKALDLPSVCNVTTPPVSMCAAAGITVGAPVASEGPSSSTASPGDMAPEGSSPNSTNDTSGSSIAITRLNFFVGLAFIISQIIF